MLSNQQIHEIYEEIQKDSNTKAILVTGSYIYGKPTDKSDLDIRMIVLDKKFSKAEWEKYKFGVRIESLYNTPEQIKEYFEQARKQTIPPNIIHFWANGKIVYDPMGIAKKLQEDAKKLWELGPYNGKWPKRIKKKKKEV